VQEQSIQRQLMIFLVIFILFCLSVMAIWSLNHEKSQRYKQHRFLHPTFLFIFGFSALYSRIFTALMENAQQLLDLPPGHDLNFYLTIFLAFAPYLLFIGMKLVYLRPKNPIKGFLAFTFTSLLMAGLLVFPLLNMFRNIPATAGNPYLFTGLSLLASLFLFLLTVIFGKSHQGSYPAGYKNFILDRFYEPWENADEPGIWNYYLKEPFGEFGNILLDPLPYGNLGGLENAIYWLVKPYRLLTIAFGVLIAYTIAFDNMDFIRFHMFSFIAVLSIGEVYGFLSGDTVPVDDGVKNDAEAILDFEKFHEGLSDKFKEYTFHEAIQMEGTGEHESKDVEVFLQGLRESEPILANYFSQLGEFDLGYAKMSRKIYGGQSTLVLNPFFRDLSPYLLLPLTKQLLDSKNVLVIGGRASQDEALNEWLRELVWKIMGTDQYFETGFLEENQERKPHIGILRANDIHDFNLVSRQREFLSKVEFILMVEPSRQVTTNQVPLNIIAGYCSPKKTVLAMDRPVDGLLDNLSHTMAVRLQEVSALQQTTEPKTFIHIFDGNAKDMHQQILPHISRYLGSGTAVFSMAQKFSLGKVDWVSDKNFPVVDMKWIAGQYYKNIAKYAGKPQSQFLVENQLQPDTALWDLACEENRVLVIEDEFNNMFDLVGLFSTRAQNLCSLNVISGNYLMRDYMLKNSQVFYGDKKAIPTLINDFVYSRRNLLFKLMMQLSAGKVRESNIKQDLEALGGESHDAIETLYALARDYLPANDTLEFQREYLDEINLKQHRYEKIGYIVMPLPSQQGEIKQPFTKKFSLSYLIVEDMAHGVDYVGSMLYNQVYQQMLPTQFITYSGKYYQVDQVNRDLNVMLKRSSEYINQRLYYRQAREYFVGELADSQQRTLGDLKISIATASEVKVRTKGYYQLKDLGDMASSLFVQLGSEPEVPLAEVSEAGLPAADGRVPDRVYLHKEILRLEFPGMKDELRSLFVVLLGELFKSTMPQTHGYLGVVAPNLSYGELFEGVCYNLQTTAEGDTGIYIIEDSEIDLGMISSVSRNLSRLLEIITDYLIWYLGEKNAPATKVLETPAESLPENDGEPVEEESPKPRGFFRKRKAVIEAPPQMEKAPIPNPFDHQFSDYLLFGHSEEEHGAALNQNIKDLVTYLQQFQFEENNLTSARGKKEAG